MGSSLALSKTGRLAIKPEESGNLIVKGHIFQGKCFGPATECRAKVARGRLLKDQIYSPKRDFMARVTSKAFSLVARLPCWWVFPSPWHLLLSPNTALWTSTHAPVVLLCYCEAEVFQTCHEPASKDFSGSPPSPVMLLGVPLHRGGLPTEGDQLWVEEGLRRLGAESWLPQQLVGSCY